MMLELTQDQLEQIQKYASIYLPITDMAMLLDLNRGTLLLAWGRHGRMSRDSARWLEARDVLLLRAVLTRERPYDI